MEIEFEIFMPYRRGQAGVYLLKLCRYLFMPD